MIISVLRKTFAKGKPKAVFYLCNINFDQDSFNKTLKKELATSPHYLTCHLKFFLRYFSPHKIFLLLINKKIRYNYNSFMIKRLRKEIMIRSKLCHKFNKSHSCVNLQNYRKQRNKCTKVLRNVN